MATKRTKAGAAVPVEITEVVRDVTVEVADPVATEAKAVADAAKYAGLVRRVHLKQ